MLLLKPSQLWYVCNSSLKPHERTVLISVEVEKINVAHICVLTVLSPPSWIFVNFYYYYFIIITNLVLLSGRWDSSLRG
jgi:hypothetical protein